MKKTQKKLRRKSQEARKKGKKKVRFWKIKSNFD